MLFLAEPVSDLTGDMMAGSGMIIYRAKNMGTARSIANDGAMYKPGARAYTLRNWLENEGGFTLAVGLSNQKIALK